MSNTQLMDYDAKSFARTLIPNTPPPKDMGQAFAPSNIALIKYWGKRDTILNLPMNDSISISLGHLGTQTSISLNDTGIDQVYLHEQLCDIQNSFYKRIIGFLDLIRKPNEHYTLNTTSTVPIAAGLASSASGFAALIMALNDLHQWNLSCQNLSVLARLGSGSACRSIFEGFAHWKMGELTTGSDSYACKLNSSWPEFRIAIINVSQKIKPIGSRQAMYTTLETSPSHKDFIAHAKAHIGPMQQAIFKQDFKSLGNIAQTNAMKMHQSMHDAKPSIDYDLPESKAIKHKIIALQAQGIPVYFTQDAGPNIKVLCLSDDLPKLKTLLFDTLTTPWDIIAPFEA